MLGCKACGALVDVTLTSCLGCGAAVAIGQFGALLGLVCRRCEAYNDPGSARCVGCGESLGLSLERGSPRAATRASTALTVRFLLERGTGAAGRVFTVSKEGSSGAAGIARIGQTQGEIRFPDDLCLAALHATVTVRDDVVLLRDDSLDAGVYVRMRGLTLPLRPGALFAIGDHLLRFAGLLAPAHAGASGMHRMGSPRPPDPAIILEEQLEGGITGRVYVRTGPSVSIGRAGCSINLGDDPYVSQRHAEIVLEAEGRARLRDLESSNGTFTRLPPGAERELQDGDRLRVGHQILKVEIG